MAETMEREHALHGGDDAERELHDRLRAEVTADREWIFASFLRWSAWTLVLIVLILSFLALTQT